jgi:endoglucanase
VQPFLDWLTAKGGRGILTEYGVPGDDARWLVALDGLLKALEGHPSVVGGTYWAAGPWWGDYRLSVEPEGGADKPQMTVLTR